MKGGTETVLFETINLLKEKGHEVILFSTDEGQVGYTSTFTTTYVKRDSSFFQKIKSLPAFFYNNKAAKDLIKILETERPDIAHIHLYLNSLSVSILPVLRRYRIPVVMTLHEYRQICPSYLLMDKDGNVCERCKEGNYLNCMLTRCAKGSFLESSLLTLEMYYRRSFYPTAKYIDKFICVSDFVFEKHQEFNSSISEKSVVIKNPVINYEQVDKKRGEYLLFVGRLSREKGLDTLLEAIKDLPNINLKIAGMGVIEYNIDLPNVEFLGFRDKKQVRELIEGAMYTVVPSQWYETFGLSCAESLSLSTPVIASRIGALLELVRDGENGFLFTPKNVMELKSVIHKAISLSDGDYYEMSKNAFRSVQELSGNNYITKLLDLYNDLLKEKS